MDISFSLNRRLINKRYNSKMDTAFWEQVTVTPEQFSELIKNGYAYCGAIFNDYKLGHNGKNFKSAELISIDIDNSISSGKQKRRKTIEEGYLSFEDALSDAFIKGNALLVYTSCSHTDDWHRFRIVFQLSEIITDREIYKNYTIALINLIGGDQGCKDIARMFYGNTEAKVRMLSNILDVDLLKRMTNNLTNHNDYDRKPATFYETSISVENAREILASIPPEPGYDIWFSIVSAVGNYFDEATAAALIDEWSPDRALGTLYKIRHRHKGYNIGTLIYYANIYRNQRGDIKQVPDKNQLRQAQERNLYYSSGYSVLNKKEGITQVEVIQEVDKNDILSNANRCYANNYNDYACVAQDINVVARKKTPAMEMTNCMPANSSVEFNRPELQDPSQNLVTNKKDNGRQNNGKKVKQPIIPYNDMGNSQRFINRYGHIVKYENNSEKWYIWNGQHWKADEVRKIIELAKDVVSSMKSEIDNEEDEDRLRRFRDWQKKSGEHAKIMNMLSLAKSDSLISISHDALDSYPFLINLKNGTFDLYTNMFQPYDAEYLLSKMAGVDYDRKAVCPFWDKFINRIFNNDTELINFVKRAIGYSMYGAIKEQVLFFCFGSGANGKSIFFEVIRSLFGDYCQKSSIELILERQNEGVPNDLARLMGVRLSQLSEMPPNRRLNESRVKDLTGGDRITARFLGKEYFEFNPVAKLWLMGNHKPRINGADDGIWRRILVIPFLVTIPENERVPMDELLAKFEMEKSGILNWFISGWKDYQLNGLNPPDIVKEESEAYREDQDIVSNFIKDSCIMDSASSIKASDLYIAYKEWSNKNGFHSESNREFYKRVEGKGVKKKTGTGNHVTFYGLKFSENPDP